MEVKIVTDSYQSCIRDLEKNGFQKYVDNGEKGLNNNVFTTTLQKENQVVTVIHMAKQKLTYMVFEHDVALSKRLFNDDMYAVEHKEGAKETLHMLESYYIGNSFVLQLKNGHFILCDGGSKIELPYLISYLESLTPEGERPVVEAWFITHPHWDHAGVFLPFEEDASYADRVYVEGIYVEPFDDELLEQFPCGYLFAGIEKAASMLTNLDGTPTQIYHPHAGERYYFDDITVEVMLTRLQVPKEKWFRYKGNMNEVSVWYMFHIDGQKYLNAGDADLGAMKEVMEIYDKEYLEMDIMAVQHHGINVHNEFTDFIKVKTLLYPYLGIYGVYKEGLDWPGAWQASVYRNEYLQNKAQESMSYGDGTKILTFPYQTGTAISLPTRGERAELTGIDIERKIQY